MWMQWCKLKAKVERGISEKLFTVSTLLITTLIFSLSASLKITSAQEHVISSQALEVEINSNSRISLALYQSSSDLYSFAYDIKTEIDGKEVRTTLLPVNQSNAYSDYELMYISVKDVQESMTKQDSLINIRVTSTCDIRYQNDDEVYRICHFLYCWRTVENLSTHSFCYLIITHERRLSYETGRLG